MDADKTRIINRLRRIQGQVRGIEKMLETDQCCTDILIQIAAVRSAVNKVGSLIFERYAANCLGQARTPEEMQAAASELLRTMNNFLKGGGG
ncbi:MAG: metal-sensitive transcriptional regulator [Firmicutes bacterium]|nr:metal-sensitive transcriptional regulator [Bacillota bacterium]HOB35748.1 metal-sensitive transcriptional regulator [Bacillota bacterium]